MRRPISNLASRLRSARIAAGISQQALADAAKVPVQTVAKIEQGVAREPTIQTMAKLARALGCTIDDLAKGMT